MKKLLLVILLTLGSFGSSVTWAGEISILDPVIFPPQSYSKLNSKGQELSSLASRWVMVRDNDNGLIWEVKQDGDDIPDYNNPHDADNIYSWRQGRHQSIDDFIIRLNEVKWGGYNDWRLPDIAEMSQLSAVNVSHPAITLAFFPYTKSSYYWTATSGWLLPSAALRIEFDHGFMRFTSKYKYFYVRAVRSDNLR